MSDADIYSHTLKHPVTLTLSGPEGERTETLTSLTMRTRIKGRDMRILDNFTGDVAKLMAMIARLSGLSAAHIDAMDSEDIEPLMAIVQGFTPPGPPTGDLSSAV